jgi:hypothetical protein
MISVVILKKEGTYLKICEYQFWMAKQQKIIVTKIMMARVDHSFFLSKQLLE